MLDEQMAAEGLKKKALRNLRKQKSLIYKNLATAHLNFGGSMEKYQEYFGKSMELFKVVTHEKNKTEAMYHNQAISLLRKGHFGIAQDALQNLLEVRKEIYGQDNVKCAEVYEILGKIWNDQYQDS